ncbi:MAG: F0F1 ATP synthase subunit delta [Gammaproteobacteria bacterium]|nr:F0F1 ATP synthase subunit delta [Gammaproteobacteria bacterium]
MQNIFTLARPYAKAAFEFALEQKTVLAWQHFLHESAAVIDNPQTIAFQRNPHTTETQLFELVKGVLGDKIDEFMSQFLVLLTSRKRLALLPAIFSLFRDYHAEHDQHVDVDVYSVTSLAAPQLAQLSSKLEARLHRKVTLHQHIDSSLIGGLLVQAGDFVIDGSLRSRLRRLTYALTD